MIIKPITRGVSPSNSTPRVLLGNRGETSSVKYLINADEIQIVNAEGTSLRAGPQNG